MAINSETNSLNVLLAQAQDARDRAQWERAANFYLQLEKALPQSPEIKHNLGLVYFGWGRLKEAVQWCAHALILNPALWQSAIIISKANKGMGEMEAAQRGFQSILGHPVGDSQARLGLADLAMNQFGNPLMAIELVRPLESHPLYSMDAQLTTLMASLYDREDWNVKGNAKDLSARVMSFADKHLNLHGLTLPMQADHRQLYDDPVFRPRVGILSPLFCVSPVYFLTIAGLRHVAKGCDIITFSRGHNQDWATDEFKKISSEWVNVQHVNAEQLARTIYDANLDVLYDLGGWMDVIGLKALSVKPARKIFKWVGGQSVTTGLSSFDGWIGDEFQSPSPLQSLYSERLIRVPGGYLNYTPPSYLPKPKKKKSKTPCIFANPAKVSRAFLAELSKMKGPKTFIHSGYRFSQTQERIRSVLGDDAQFITPTSHQAALEAVNEHAVMIDTFPYSSGLTAREAMAMGTRVKVLHVGQLFCERHTAYLLGV